MQDKQNIYQELFFSGSNNSGYQSIVNRLKQNDPNLQVIDFSQKNLTSIESKNIFEALKGNTQVKILKFLGNNSSGEAAEVLGKLLQYNNTIEELYLGTNELNNIDLLNIVDGLKYNKSIYLLDLNSNLFDNPQYIADLLEHNTAIKDIDLTNSKIDDNGFVTIYQGLCKNKHSSLEEFNVYFPKISCMDDFENFCKKNASKLESKFSN